MKKYYGLVAWVLTLQVLGLLSGCVKGSGADTWYLSLHKSALTPPGFVFGVVWPMIYVMIAVVGWKLWQKSSEVKFNKDKVLYILQLVINFSWTPLFFYFHLISISMAVIIVLLILVGMLVLSLLKKSKLCAFLLMPYFLWLCFALYLNYFIFINN